MFTLIMETLYKYLLKYDEKYCEIMSFFNPYTDPFPIMFNKKIPMFDKQAFLNYPKYNFVYDKLWVCQSQKINCGTLDSINKNDEINYPIFIKPRWGHMTSSSKNCFKVTCYEKLKKYKKLKNMMWSEYIDGTEMMTDYVLVNGNIVYSITYYYSENQTGYIEKWKYISSDNKSLPTLSKWINKYLSGYSGIVNLQCRNDTIIEVSLRMARGGSYIQSTENENIIKLINNIYDNNNNNIVNNKLLDFKPYYAFKCYTSFPIMYIYPQYFIDFIMFLFGSKDFYEYYFEPNGNDGMVFFQFYHNDYKKGTMCSNIMVYLIILIQIILILILFIILYSFLIYNKINYLLITVFVVIFFTQYLNPISVHYNWYKLRKQKSLG